MSKRQVLMILGVWTAVLLFLGIPSSWDKFLAVLTGLIIIFVAYRLKPEVSVRKTGPLSYVEHKTPNDNITSQNIPPAQ